MAPLARPLSLVHLKLWPTVAAAAGFTAMAAGGAGVAAVNHGSSAPAEAQAATTSPLLTLPALPSIVIPAVQPPPPPAPVVAAPATAAVHAVTASLPVRPAAPRKPAAAPAPPPGRPNYLTSDDGTLSTSVGTYSDCSGQSPLGTDAAILTCITGRLYFVGHNLGVFTPLMHMGVGSGITYYDARGTAHHYRVIGVRDNWVRANGPPPVLQSNVVAQFQTCETPDGTTDRILDAVGDPPDPVAPVVAAATAPVAAAATPVATTATATAKPITGSIWSLLFGHS